MYASLAGVAPQSADVRTEGDRHVSATKLFFGKYTRHLLQTIDWCLRLDHLERPQSVLSLQKVLLYEKSPQVSAKSGLMESLRETFLRLALPKFRNRREAGTKPKISKK